MRKNAVRCILAALLLALFLPLAQAEQDNASVSAANEKAEQATSDLTRDEREQIVAEALEALNLTVRALHALDDQDSKAALKALEQASGKLDVLLARKPELSLAPVDVRVFTRDLHASTTAIEEARKSALRSLNNGDVQQARQILQGLASEVEIQVVNLPMGTYPSAIQAVVPLIDSGRVDQARAALQAVLNTLVIESTVIPLPLLRAQLMLEAAEVLAENPERTNDQSMDLHTLLDSAREQLRLAEALGYGRSEQFEPMYEQIELIHEKTRDNQSGSGFFDKIKQALSTLQQEQDSHP